MLDLDPIGDQVAGKGYLFRDREDENPSSYTSIQATRFAESGELQIEPHPFNPRIGFPLNGEDMSRHFPNFKMPTSASLKYNFELKNILNVVWETDTGTHGQARLVRPDLNNSRHLHIEKSISSWNEFKEFVANNNPRDTIYRGQSGPYPLQTSFHRTSRKDLTRYRDNDIAILHRALSSKTRHFFDLGQPQQLGAFLNLAQHHGFPTPLLDWSYSPYVAAYFAYSGVGTNSSLDGSVRIFCLDKHVLSENTPQYQYLTYVFPHLSILEALSIENDRAVPQQGLLTLTNVQDIESFLHVVESRIGNQILKVIDLPKTETRRVMAELKLMGITQSSLFPGIESICLDIRKALF